LLDRFIEKFTTLSAFLAKAAAVILFIISVLVCVHVVLRGLFNGGIEGIYEIVQYGMLTVVSITLAENEMSGGNIIVNVLLDKMKPRTANAFSIGMYIVATVAMAYILVNQVKMIFQKYATGATTGVLAIPHWILVLIICVGLFFFVIAFIIRINGMVKSRSSLPGRKLTVDEIAAETVIRSEF